MKKLLLLTGLLLSMAAQSQDFTYLQNLNSLPTEADALNVANEIAAFSTNKLRLYKAKDTPTQKNLRYTYAPAELSDKDIEGHTYTDAQANCFVTIDFVYFNEGENSDLEIKGVKKYSLSTVQTKYLNLFPFWKQYFKPTAEAEKTLTDYSSQRIIDGSRKVFYYIMKQGNSWVLKNQS